MDWFRNSGSEKGDRDDAKPFAVTAGLGTDSSIMSDRAVSDQIEADNLKSAYAEADADTTYSALKSLAEMLMICDDDEPINSYNLSCLVTVIAERLEPSEGS